MKFDYNPRILEQLGTELITSDEVAFTELLKNAYDAHASAVRVHFLENLDKLDTGNLLVPVSDAVLANVRKVAGNAPLIVIEDNGHGMDYQQLKRGFFQVGSDIKEEVKRKDAAADRRDQMILGDKGLGRLSSQRLASRLVVETSSRAEQNVINVVDVEWAKFSKNREEDAPEFILPAVSDESFTRLWFSGNVNFGKFIDDRREAQVNLFGEEGQVFLHEKLQSSVSFLYSPFEGKQEDFKVEFFLNSLPVQSSFHDDSIRIAETIHRFDIKIENGKAYITLDLELKPWYVEIIHLRLIGKSSFMDRQADPGFYAGLLEKYKERFKSNLSRRMPLDAYLSAKEKLSRELPFIRQIVPLKGEVYAFHRESFRLNLAIKAAKATGAIEQDSTVNQIREFLNHHNGIKLYRDKFRIANLGDKESDWLNLQQARTRGQQFFRFELGNVVGYIKITDFFQKYIKEISSRQELMASPNANALRNLVQSVFNDDFYQLSTTAYYLTRDILTEEGLVKNHTPKELKKQVDESEASLRQTLKSLALFQDAFSDIKENIKLDSPERIQKVREIIAGLDSRESSLSDSLKNSISTLENAKETLTVIEERQKESYNNYKLMANGLITEVMTHELHAILLNSKSGEGYEEHVENLRKHLLGSGDIDLYNNDLKPLSGQLDFLHKRIMELDVFYNFLESTFIRQGTRDDFEYENLGALLSGFGKRLDTRFREARAQLIHPGLNTYTWYVPKGTLTHVFYNLIDNSLHWISERQKRAAYDQNFKWEGKDFIQIEQKGPNTVHYYDSGTGVLDDMEYTLFHPFKSGKKDGRGMGLYIVRNLLESFGGSISLLPDRNHFGNRYIFSISNQTDDQA